MASSSSPIIALAEEEHKRLGRAIHVLLMCLHYYGMLYYHNTKCTADTPPLVSKMKENIKFEAIRRLSVF